MAPKYFPAHPISTEPAWKTFRRDFKKSWPMHAGFLLSFVVFRVFITGGLDEWDRRNSPYYNPYIAIPSDNIRPWFQDDWFYWDPVDHPRKSQLKKAEEGVVAHH
eukprot:TRINITY_DN43006_c0_g1_i1.p2 TRINITY_DN43006_c0_g1~~TRINITY_DN43006_c0_g1_i1.p2  ORF type:complete len:105 (+),score=3.04 TRINITY_DN43006_c0_g1_i1:163-477(+)